MNNLKECKKRNKHVLKYMIKNRNDMYNFKEGNFVSIKKQFLNEMINGRKNHTLGFRFMIIKINKDGNGIKIRDKLDSSKGDHYLKYYNIEWFEKEKLDLDIINIHKHKHKHK